MSAFPIAGTLPNAAFGAELPSARTLTTVLDGEYHAAPPQGRSEPILSDAAGQRKWLLFGLGAFRTNVRAHMKVKCEMAISLPTRRGQPN